MLDGSIARAVNLRAEMQHSAAEPDHARSLLERARWRVFIDGLPWVIGGSLGAGVAVAIAIASVSDVTLPLIWFLAFTVVSALRAVTVKRYAKPAILSRSPALARGILHAGAVASGIVWGVGSFWIIAANDHLIESVILSFCAAGMTAAAAASYSAVAWGFASFTLPYLGFLIVGLFMASHEASFAMALAVLFFAMGMGGISRAIGKRITNALTLWLVNKQLYRKTAAALAEAHRATVLATERERTELEAKAASEAKTQFLATMSHELRTPLNAIVGFSDSMLTETFGPLAPKYREYAAHIRDSGTVLSDLVTDLLELSRIELGHHSIERNTVSVADLFADVEKMFQQTPTRQLPPLRFDLDPPDITLEADRRMLWQILINLVGNAVKFSPLTRTIYVDGERLPDGWVRLCVRDSGVGIAEEDLGRITDAFYQGRDSAVLAQAGVGLGLSLVKSFVDLHGGDLKIESRVGKGTTVTVKLPQAP